MTNIELKKWQFQFIAYLFICLVLASLSIFSTLGTFALFISESTKGGEIYHTLMDKKMALLDSMNCTSLTGSQIESKREALNAILTQSVKNSRGVTAGSLGAMSSNCLGKNWYAKNRCSTYLAQKLQVESEIKESQSCSGLSSKLQSIENQLEKVPPSSNLALFTLISSVTTYSENDMVFLIFICLAILIEISIVFQTFTFNRKETLSNLLLLIVLAVISIGLNLIFWSSLGNFSTGFQIFSGIVGIVLDVMKINFMLDISEIYSLIKSKNINDFQAQVIEGSFQNLNTKPVLNVPDKITENDNLKGKKWAQKALEEGDITCNKDEILNYLRMEYDIEVKPSVVGGWMKEWFSNHPPT